MQAGGTAPADTPTCATAVNNLASPPSGWSTTTITVVTLAGGNNARPQGCYIKPGSTSSAWFNSDQSGIWSEGSASADRQLVCDVPTSAPTSAPTTNAPTNAPTTNAPTNAPTTNGPTNVPTNAPTNAPANASTNANAPMNAPTSAPTNANPNASAPTPTPVVVTVTVTNVDYNLLSADTVLMTHFKNAIKDAIAAAHGGILPSHITVVVSAGSVVAAATITPPVGVDSTSVYANVSASAAQTTIGNTVISALNGVNGFSAVTTGNLSISISASLLTPAPTAARTALASSAKAALSLNVLAPLLATIARLALSRG